MFAGYAKIGVSILPSSAGAVKSVRGVMVLRKPKAGQATFAGSSVGHTPAESQEQLGNQGNLHSMGWRAEAELQVWLRR